MPQERSVSHPPWSRYLGSFVSLLGLTLLSLGVSYLHTGAWELPIALLIAVVKSLLVLLIFMHLSEVKFVNAFVVILALALLSMLLLLVAADVTTRHTFPPGPLPEIPPGPPPQAPPPGGVAGLPP